MSKKSQARQANPESSSSQFGLIAAVVGVLALVVVSAVFLYQREAPVPLQDEAAARQAALASEHSPSMGNPDAKVQIVEFLDPACETCALFFPMVKQWMAQVPGQIHLKVRHLAFHKGSDYALKVLEASRNQDKYWQTLEVMLASQDRWVQNHVVQPEQIVSVIAGVGLNMEQLMADMNTEEIAQRIAKDKQDSVVLLVSATPEYFVNGRPLPSFGQQQLANLIRDELSK
jgi:protein-disulfide isomerase